MAWVAVETFESYANGNDLNTLNGGSGWSNAWSTTTGSKYFISSTTPYQGSLCVRGATINTNADRALSVSVSAGIVYFAMMRPDTAGDDTFYLKLLFWQVLVLT